MNAGREIKWTKAEKVVARRAFEAAYRRECEAIVVKLKEMTAVAAGSADLWSIHDYLGRRRRDIEEKYDYRYSVLVHVLANLLREGWLTETDLCGLGEDKVEVIKYLASPNVGEDSPRHQPVSGSS